MEGDKRISTFPNLGTGRSQRSASGTQFSFATIPNLAEVGPTPTTRRRLPAFYEAAIRLALAESCRRQQLWIMMSM
jgi:hypothetical protein